MSKTCPSCKIERSLEEFHKDRTSNTGYAYYCKMCATSKARAFYHEKCSSSREYKKTQSDRYKKKKFNLTGEEYDSLLKSQGTCAICGVALTGGSQSHLDHCHSTGKIRAFLCTNCNRGLGHFKDNTDILQKAINYINGHTNER